MAPFFSVERVGKFTVVQFQTESLMNSNDLERIGQGLYQLVDEGTSLLVLNFAPVKYLSSQAIGIVLALHKKLSHVAGAKLMLCGVSPALLQLLKITRLDRLLTIKGTVKEAIE